jgi:integrase
MNLQSPLAEQLSAYMNFRRAVGFCSEDAFFFLERFDRFLVAKNHSGPLTEQLALEFANLNPNTTLDYRARRYQVVRHFSQYLATFDPETPLLNPKVLERSKIRAPRHIYTNQELQTLLDEARHLSPKIPFYGLTLQTAIGLAASSGLRISEIVRLDKTDADVKTGILNIRNSKFNKSRLVPIHDTTRSVLYYAAARDSAFPAHASSPGDIYGACSL